MVDFSTKSPSEFRELTLILHDVAVSRRSMVEAEVVLLDSVCGQISCIWQPQVDLTEDAGFNNLGYFVYRLPVLQDIQGPLFQISP